MLQYEDMFRADGTYVNLLSINRVKSRGVALPAGQTGSVHIITTDFNLLDRKSENKLWRTVG